MPCEGAQIGIMRTAAKAGVAKGLLSTVSSRCLCRHNMVISAAACWQCLPANVSPDENPLPRSGFPQKRGLSHFITLLPSLAVSKTTPHREGKKVFELGGGII